MTDFPKPSWNTRRPDRRRALLGLAASGAAMLLPLPGRAQQADSTCVLTPDSGEGPFYFDPDLLRSDIRAGAEGALLDLEVEIRRESDCASLEDARFDLWHADAIGLYSGYARQPGTGEPSPSVTDKTWLRGTQLSDSDGRVRFRTVWPSWYRGRTPHLHFKVFVSDNEVVASQLYLPDEFNEEVFHQFAPYKDRIDRRDTFNRDDQFLRGEVQGAMCNVERSGEGYLARASVVIRS